MRGMSLTALFSDFFSFILHPVQYSHDLSLSKFGKLRNIGILISWIYAVIFPLAIIIGILLSLINYTGKNAIEEFAQENSFVFLFLFGAILAPLVEEFTFRLWLRFSPLYLSVSAFLVSRIIFRLLTAQLHILPEDSFLYSYGLPIAIGLSMYIFVTKPGVSLAIQRFYETKYRYIFLSSFLSFGLLHIFNYSDRDSILTLSLVLTLPQILVGIVLSYVRVQYGFWYAVFMHSFYNAMLLIPASVVKDINNPSTMIFILWFLLLLFAAFMFGLVTLIYSSYQVLVKKQVR
jgi:membrane protease YdiL (CAAX protease family)